MDVRNPFFPTLLCQINWRMKTKTTGGEQFNAEGRGGHRQVRAKVSVKSLFIHHGREAQAAGADLHCAKAKRFQDRLIDYPADQNYIGSIFGQADNFLSFLE